MDCDKIIAAAKAMLEMFGSRNGLSTPAQNWVRAHDDLDDNERKLVIFAARLIADWTPFYIRTSFPETIDGCIKVAQALGATHEWQDDGKLMFRMTTRH